MKRQREEADGEEEQAPPTPMAVSPPRSPSPASPAPSPPESPYCNLWPRTATPPPSEASHRHESEEDGDEAPPPPTPMVASPPRSPASPAPSSPGSPYHNLWPRTATPPPAEASRRQERFLERRAASHGREVTWNDALDFVLNVRNALNQAQYCEFIHTFTLFDSIGPRRLVQRVRALLRGYPELKRQFNLFVPAHFELDLSGDDDDQ